MAATARKIRTYSELIRLSTYEDRLRYLRLEGRVGFDTFGFDRYLNQMFYQSNGEWLRIRDKIIARDNGCDLGLRDYDITGRIIVHHMNPIAVEDIVDSTDILLNPEYLICASHNTHNAIHYGSKEPVRPTLIERRPNDTCPWKK